MSKLWNLVRREKQAFLQRGKVEATEFLKDDLLRARRGGGGPIAAARLGYGSVSTNARASTNNITRMARAAFARPPADDTVIHGNTPQEQFAYAQDIYERDDDYVVSVQDNKYRVFLLYVAIAAGILAINIASWNSYSSGWLMICAHIAPIVPACLMAFAAAFQNWQLRSRRLGGLGTFMRSPAQWWPEATQASGYSGVARSAAAIVVVGSALVSATIMGTAPAANADPVTANSLFSALPSSDIWGRLLTFCFPGIGPISGTVTPLNNGITNGLDAMISMLMLVATISLSYQTVIATAETAHTAEVLGRRWHTMWAPIRVCYGFASLAPVVKGYCLLQLLVIYVSVMSGHIGNTIWAGFVTGLNGTTISAPNLPQTIPLVRDVMRMEVCSATQDQITAGGGSTWPAQSTAGSQPSATMGQYWTYITSFWSNNAKTTAPWTIHHRTWDYGPCGTISGDYADTASGDLGVLATSQLDAIDAMRSKLHGIAASVVASTQSGPTSIDQATLDGMFSTVTDAKNQLDTDLQNGLSKFINGANSNASLSSFQSSATDAGWVSAGAYYMTVARINSSQVDAARNMPVVDTSSFDKNRDAHSPLIEALYGANGSMTTFEAWWSKNIDSPTGTGLDIAAASAGTMKTGGAYSYLKSAGSSDSYLQKLLMNQVKLDPSQFNGMQEIIDMGDYIVGIGEVVVGGPVILKGIAMVFPAGRIATLGSSLVGRVTGGESASLLTGPMSFVGIFVGTLGMALMGAGIYDCLILPMMPFMLFTFATMGILITVVEGVVAAPIWAFMHCKMDGETLIDQQQRAGYSILFNLLFRIPLTLFGLFFSMTVFNAMIFLLSITLYPAMASTTANSLFGVLGTIVYIILITGMNYGVANRSFSLITQVPDRVTRWFGASDHNGDEGSHAHNAVALVKGGAAQAATGVAQAMQGSKGAGKAAAAGNNAASTGANLRNQISQSAREPTTGREGNEGSGPGGERD